MKILFLGDCHTAWHRLIDGIERATAEHGIEAAIQVGDFGFFAQKMQLLLTGWSGRFPVPLHVIDGNHEDHAFLKRAELAGDFDRWEADKTLIPHRRGTIITLGGWRFGLCGGALHADRRQDGSIDKGTTNWLTNKQADGAADAFNASPPDVIVTHSCPHSIRIGMLGSPNLVPEVERYVLSKGFDPGPITDCGEPGLTRLWSQLHQRPKHWIFGHFHVHHAVHIQGTKFHCIGSIDGSDNLSSPRGYLLDTSVDSWSGVAIGRLAE